MKTINDKRMLMVKTKITAQISINGARSIIRRDIIRVFCSCVKSLVRHVMREAELKTSILKENDCIFSNNPLRILAANPWLPSEDNFIFRIPKPMAKAASAATNPPIPVMNPRLFRGMPTSTVFAMRIGIKSSQAISPVTRNRQKITSFLYVTRKDPNFCHIIKATCYSDCGTTPVLEFF